MPSRRPLFDPSRMAGPQTPATPATITVTQLTSLVKGAITRGMPATLYVVGELSNVSQPDSGHLYFTLKDESSEVRCVMWRSAAVAMKFEARDGQQVVATGGVDVYEPRGQYQLYVRKLEPRGVGTLELAFRQLREKLEREGLFDAGRKKPLPKWPRRIGIVTSPTGAAIRDMLEIIRRRYPCVDILVYPVRVQGDGASEEIAAGIRVLNRVSRQLGGIDVMIVGRGGGSLEDLWAFNEERVARAIHASRIPVVSAVGHEVDITISDLVADVRAPTPSAAAELVTPVLDDVLAMLSAHSNTLHRHARHALDISVSRLDAVVRNELFRDPLGRLRQRGQRIDEAQGRLRLAMTGGLSRVGAQLQRWEVALSAIRPEACIHRQQQKLTETVHRLQWAMQQAAARAERRLVSLADQLRAASPSNRVDREGMRLGQLSERLGRAIDHRVVLVRQQAEGLAARLDAVGYRQVLARGYSITRTSNRRTIVTSPGQVRPGDRVITETAGGELESRVLDSKQPELFE